MRELERPIDLASQERGERFAHQFGVLAHVRR
jgi:hypothetical protein